MTLSAFAAGLLITAVTVTIELLDRDIKKEQEEFNKRYAE